MNNTNSYNNTNMKSNDDDDIGNIGTTRIVKLRSRRAQHTTEIPTMSLSPLRHDIQGHMPLEVTNRLHRNRLVCLLNEALLIATPIARGKENDDSSPSREVSSN